MSNKSGKIALLIARCHGRALPAHYLGYFECFNAGLYYEAHDVLEELWLGQRHGPNDGFYKGLIQFAGAFVHLQKGRLRPAVALFRLSQSYLRKYPQRHEHLDISHLIALAEEWAGAVERSDFSENPLESRKPPFLSVDAQD